MRLSNPSETKARDVPTLSEYEIRNQTIGFVVKSVTRRQCLKICPFAALTRDQFGRR